MQRLLAAIAVSVVLSACVSFFIVTLLAPPQSGAQAVAVPAVTPQSDGATVAQLSALQRKLEDLEVELENLRHQDRSARRSLVAGAVNAGDGVTSGRPLDRPALEALFGGGDVFREQVAQVITQIEEQKEAVAWEEELVERQEEAALANSEYDEFNTTLETRLVAMQDNMRLGNGQVDDMRSLLALQNDRNREMTRLWSQGDTSEEELGRIFEENRIAHRTELTALLGPEQLGAYRKHLREKSLGGRFSFFVGAWDDWNKGEQEK